ncbi:ead/Ea22-like family protein [Pseudomonas aeruginosa]|uniref:ead/Ea22-like family protein n=2 Tax=Pseudomonas aeruginosa TaxID=287 RepID=UPI002E287460|nr:ead/Ea22-like family protein [Pseudomonas aeruginosa]MEE2492734.1 ead/Ea22-like family protein [Pseudomonas aeruginosa]MEE3577978.1 ead/Ea22-like family protein [Pseudomonas aeruginosa]
MTDLTKLKELAERATPGPWSAAWEEGDDTAWPNLFPVIQAGNGEVVIGNEGFYTDLEQDKANATFCAAANPQAILGLIAEVERLRTDAARYRWLRERDLETIRRGGVFAGMTPENIVLNLEDLDAEIDAAIEGDKQ